MAIILKKNADERCRYLNMKKALLTIKAVPLNTIFSYSTILYHADFYSQ